jgi:hypothetical protein
MSESSNKSSASGSSESCLEITLRSEASHIRTSDGRDIAFTRAMLTMRNACAADVVDLVPHISLGQESGTMQDVSHAVAGSAVAVPPGGSITWDVFEQLVRAHPGTASKINMFGYRAVLNWLFELSVWAAYRVSGSASPVKTPVLRWTLRWSVTDPSTGAVGLAIEEAKE